MSGLTKPPGEEARRPLHHELHGVPRGRKRGSQSRRAGCTPIKRRRIASPAAGSIRKTQVETPNMSGDGSQEVGLSLPPSITLLSRIIDLLRECRVAIGTASGRSQ